MAARQGYREDLAYVHDAGFGRFAELAAPFLLAALGRSLAPGCLVVDIGCGSGGWARRLTDAGYAVLGIDQSRALLSLARARAPRAVFQQGSFLDIDLPPCDAVTALGEVLNYCFDERNGPRALSRLFRRVHAALRPGGLFAFDLALPGRVPGGGPAQGHRAGADWAVLFESEEDRGHRFLTRRITTFRRVGRGYRRGEEVHLQRLYPEAKVAAALRRAGFSVRTSRSYGRFRLPPGLAAFLARRPPGSGSAVRPGAATGHRASGGNAARARATPAHREVDRPGPRRRAPPPSLPPGRGRP